VSEFRSVIDIDVKAESFTAFLEAFNRYKEMLDKMPKQWAQVSDAIREAAGAADSFKAVSTSADQIAQSIAKVDANLQNVTKSAKSVTDAIKQTAEAFRAVGSIPTLKDQTQEKIKESQPATEKVKKEEDSRQKEQEKAAKELEKKRVAEEKAAKKYAEEVAKAQAKKDREEAKAREKQEKAILAEQNAKEKEIQATLKAQEKFDKALKKEQDKKLAQEESAKTKRQKQMAQEEKAIDDEISKTLKARERYQAQVEKQRLAEETKQQKAEEKKRVADEKAATIDEQRRLKFEENAKKQEEQDLMRDFKRRRQSIPSILSDDRALNKKKDEEYERERNNGYKEAEKNAKKIETPFKSIRSEVNETTKTLKEWATLGLGVAGLYEAKKFTFDYGAKVAGEIQEAKGLGLSLTEKRAAEASEKYGINAGEVLSTIAEKSLSFQTRDVMREFVGAAPQASNLETYKKLLEYAFKEVKKPNFGIESQAGQVLTKYFGMSAAAINQLKNTSETEQKARMANLDALLKETPEMKKSAQAITQLGDATSVNLAKMSNAWTEFVGKISPGLINIENGFTDVMVGMSKGLGGVAELFEHSFVENLEKAVEGLWLTIKGTFDLRDLFDSDLQAKNTPPLDKNSWLYKMLYGETAVKSPAAPASLKDVPKGLFGKESSAAPANDFSYKGPIVYDKSKFAEIEKAEGLPAGTLAKIEQNESAGGKNLSYAGKGAYGFFQMKPSTAKDYDPNVTMEDLYDEKKSAQLAAKHLHRLMTKTHGNLSEAVLAYHQGETILDKGASPLSRAGPLGKDYLRKFENQPANAGITPPSPVDGNKKTSSAYPFTIIQPQSVVVQNMTGSLVQQGALQAATGLTQAA